MDLTQIFKANVKAVKLRNKATSSLIGGPTIQVPDKNRILQKQNHDEFSKLAKDICYKITELRNLLIENRAAYMRFAQHLKNSAQMTDEQRDLIDRESEKFITYYTQYLNQIRSDWRRKQKLKKQFKEHIENVIDLLMNYLKSVNNLHVEQKKYRIQHELETYRLLKLASDKKNIPKRPGNDNMIKKKNNHKILDSESEDEHNENENYNDSNKNNDNDESKNEKSKVNDEKKLTAVQQVALDDDLLKSQQPENELSAEDIQMFESENNQLYQELQGLSEEVEQIEKNVVDIARLQEVFTEKVGIFQILISLLTSLHCLQS